MVAGTSIDCVFIFVLSNHGYLSFYQMYRANRLLIICYYLCHLFISEVTYLSDFFLLKMPLFIP